MKESKIPSKLEKNIQPFNQLTQVESMNHTLTSISEPLASIIVDPDYDRENPAEAKYRRLIRSHRSGLLDRELKPNPRIRDDLKIILNYPPTKELSPSEKNLMWKFRFYLARDKRALTKFLKSVTWTDASEVHQAVDILLPLWTEPDTEDALELLGPGFIHPKVRSYGVKLLSRADNEELLLYLLQLVQAIKFETSKYKHSQNKFNHFNSGLVDLLIRRAVQNDVLGNNLYWYLMVECSGSRYEKLYARVTHSFLQSLVQTPNGNEKRDILKKQAELVECLSKVAKRLRSSKDPRPRKIDNLRNAINDSRNHLSTLPIPLSLPVDARTTVNGINAEKSSVFKSNLFPMLLYFQNNNATSTNEFPIIFKDGDDLRQDQLVVQLFTLMDRLLRKENLDLRLKLFKVLATDTTAGMVQYIPNKTLSTAVNDHGSLLEYFKNSFPNESSLMTFGVEPAILDNFVRSCGELTSFGSKWLTNLK
ncbi:hypothetical protein E3P78_00336 [Wallemia ichthyophaga]|nr:hypothetical protein E3P78_00336 [Wallemia ichthyophaga]